MKKDSLRVADYLSHMLQALARIERYVADIDEVSFLNNALIQDAVIRNIEVLGEAAKNIERNAPEFAAEHPEIPVEEIYLMRNRVAHGYFSIDFELVWRTIQRELPILHTDIHRLHQTLQK